MARALKAFYIGLAALVLGEISVALSVPPDFLVPVWIPAGLAVAASRLWDRVMLLPLALATFLIALDLSLRIFGTSFMTATIFAAMIALGTIGQTEIARLAWRGVDNDRFSTLERLPDLARIALVAAPLAAIPMAVCFSAGIFAAGLDPDLGYGSVITRAWVSSLVGTVVFAPFILLVCAPATVSLRRKITVAIPMAILMAVLAILFSVSRMDAIADRREAFRSLTTQHRIHIVEQMISINRRLTELSGLFAASESVTEDEFDTFVGIVFSRFPGGRTVHWASRIDGPGETAPHYVDPQPGASMDPILVPMSGEAPYPALQTLVPEDDFRHLLERVQASGRVEALSTGSDPDSARLLIAAPGSVQMPASNGLAPAGAPLAGLAIAEMSWGAILHRGAIPQNPSFIVTLIDPGTAVPVRLAGSENPPDSPLLITYPLGTAGLDLELRYTATYRFLAEHQDLTSWALLVSGLLFTALLNALSMMSTARTDLVQRLVDQKTGEVERLARDMAAILEHAADGILALDGGGHIRTANPAALQLLHGRSEGIEGRPLSALLATATAETLLSSGDPVAKDQTLRLERADGSETVVEYSSAPLANPGSETPGRVIVLRDITDREARQAERDQFISELSRANEELERFAFAASHDLQEPLRLISNFNALLARRHGEQLGDSGLKYIEHSIAAAERMQALISDLLTYGRIAHESQTPLKRVNLGDVLIDVLGNLETTTRPAQARIVVGDMPEVAGHATQLGQVFQNLIGNALKYRHKDTVPDIAIEAEEKPDCWQISISDNGIGIDPKYHDAVFQPFKRLHGKDEFSGTGMGLAITRKIIEGHGGVIWIAPNPGGGSRFTFTLPKHDRPADEL
jgi:PAS domain S-box-containing protein